RMIETWADLPEKKEFLSKVDLDINNISPEHLHEFAKNGDIFSHQVWQLFGRYLGAGLASLVNISGIENIIVGGGVTRAWDFFIEPTMAEIKKSTYAEISSKVAIHRTKLLDDAGILGAAKTVFDIS
ncbi:ROK family protein, partial [bacterium]|nr:ROK family protein [bacterium]